MHTPTGAVELPAVIGAGETPVDGSAFPKCAAPVYAGVSEHVRVAFAVAKRNEGEAGDPGAQGVVAVSSVVRHTGYQKFMYMCLLLRTR